MFKRISIVTLLAICLFCVLTACTPVEKPCVHQCDFPIEQVDATCVTDGTLEHKTCIWCGKHFDTNDNELAYIVIPAKGHSFGDWVKTQKPTTTKEGVETRTCGVCQTEETRSIPVLVESSFTVTYDLNGGTMHSSTQNPTTYKNTDDDIAIVAVPYKQGYVFIGWTSGDEEPNADYVIESGTEQNLTLVANYTQDTTLYNGKTFDPTPDEVRGYLDTDNKAKYLYDYAANNGPADYPKPVNFYWENANTAATSFTLTIAYDKDYKNIFSQKTVEKDNALEYNFYPHFTYYYKIEDNFGNVVKMDTFAIEEPLRLINLGLIRNVRDIGGYKTSTGTLRYGLAYRSPEIVMIHNEAGIDILVNQLHVKTEIDVRLEAVPDTVDPSITKHQIGILQWDYNFPGLNKDRPFAPERAEAIRKIFQLLADKNNYPLLFHCSAGADRTGTLAFMLSGFLGVSYEDLAIDFELTSFFSGKRWRSNVAQDENGNYYFDDSGVMMDTSYNLVDFGKCYKHILNTYAKPGETFSKAMENYLKTVVGVTQAELDAIREIWIEPDTTTANTQNTQQITRLQPDETTDSQKLVKTLNAPVVDTSKKQGLQDETIAC